MIENFIGFLFQLITSPLQALPAPIQVFLSLGALAFCGFVIGEWRLLGQPGNDAFKKQIERVRAKAEGVAISERYRDWLDSLLNGMERLFGPVSEAAPGSRSVL